MPATRAIQQCASWRTQNGGSARGYHECFASLTALQIPLRPPHAGPPARILCIGGACRELTNLPRTGSSSMARRETLAAPMRSVDRCETCQPRTEADGKVVTESNLSLRVPARVAAVLYSRIVGPPWPGCRARTMNMCEVRWVPEASRGKALVSAVARSRSLPLAAVSLARSGPASPGVRPRPRRRSHRRGRWHGPGRADVCPIYAVFLADAVHLVPQVVAGHGQLLQVAGRLSEPRRDRATARVSPAQSRPTVSTTMSGMLPVLSP